MQAIKSGIELPSPFPNRRSVANLQQLNKIFLLRSQCFPYFFCGFCLSGLLVVVRIDPQPHVHRAVSSQVLDFFDIQSGLKHTGDVGVAEDMCGDMCIRKFCADVPPHTFVRRLCHGFAVFHGEHEFGMGFALLFFQPERKFLRHGDIPASCFRFEVIADYGCLFLDDGIVADMDGFFLEINVFPHQTEDLASTHPGVEGNQQEGSSPDVFDLFQKQTAFLRGQGSLFFCPFAASFQHTAHRRLGDEAIFHSHCENAAQMNQDLRLQGNCFFPQGLP